MICKGAKFRQQGLCGPTFLTFNEKNLNKYSNNQEMKYNCVWCEIHC